MAKLLGHNLRVMVGTKCVACATDCTLDIQVDMEDSNSKDDVSGIWKQSDVVAKGWNVSCNSLYDPDAAETTAITSAELMNKIVNGKNTDELSVQLKFCVTTGDKNRSEVSSAKINYHGTAVYNALSVSASAKQKVTFAHTFTGNGKLNDDSAGDTD